MEVVKGPNAPVSPKRPRPNFQSLETSFDVFMRFVKETADGKVDCSKMVGKECYERWLQTRIKPPSKPAESFRRALTAHCRGVDGRRPFPPKVEASLLEVLRECKIWSCFENTTINIGSRGYKAVGYWEKKKLEESNSESKPRTSPAGTKTSGPLTGKKGPGQVNIPNGASKNEKSESEEKSEKGHSTSKKRKEAKMKMQYSSCSEDSSDGDALGGMDLDSAVAELLRWEKFVKEQKERMAKRALKKETSAETDVDHSASSEKLGTPVSNCDIIAKLNSLHMMSYTAPRLKHCKKIFNTLLKFNQDKSRLMVASSMQRLELDVTNPDLLDKVERLHEEGKEQVLISKEFVLPDPKDCQFDNSKPIGWLTADTGQFVILECDDTVKEMYRGDISGMHSVQLRATPTHVMMHLSTILENYMRDGIVWSRSLERRLDGTPIIMLNRYTKSEIADSSIVACQDITDKYGHLIPAYLCAGGTDLESRKRRISRESK
mmetsp:Transcript_3709/g.4265  ORF Transcript_3709/g.4265 Transcript_3709/m.4265 type:complete len:491 (-) Transcript_3709:84-1556(-)